MKSIIVEVEYDRVGFFTGKGYAIYLPLTEEKKKLIQKANQFTKETGLKTEMPSRNYLLSLCKEELHLFEGLPQEPKEIKPQKYKITIEQLKRR